MTLQAHRILLIQYFCLSSTNWENWFDLTGSKNTFEGSNQNGIFSFEWTNPPGTFSTYKHTQWGDAAASNSSESCTVSDENN